MEVKMFRDEFKESYTTIPFAIYRENSPSGNLDLISHRHKEIELIPMTEGEATFYIDSTPYKTEKGDIIITLGCGDIYKAAKMMLKEF